MSHPSYLALDRHALGVTSPEIEAHLRECERCRAHFDTLAQPLPEPEWLETTVGSRRSYLWIPAVALLAAGVLAFVRIAPETTPYIGTKGEPVVSVYVLHDGVVVPWEGEPIAVGDSLRLGVRPEGYDHVSVRSGDAVLYADALDGSGEILLPRSWRVDDEGSHESLVVVLDDEPIDDGPPASDSWQTTLTLPKQVNR